MPQVTNKRIVVFKSEGATPGTTVTIADADFDVRLRSSEITLAHEMDDENSKFARGDHGEDVSIPGPRTGTISCMAKMCGVTTIATETPKYFKVLQACGLKAVNYGTPVVGRALQPLAEADCQTLTGRVYDIFCGAAPAATAEELSGMCGTLTIGAEAPGAPVIAEMEFTGKYTGSVDVANADIPVLTSPSTVEAEPFLGATITITPIGGSAFTPKVQSFNLDTGLTIAPIKDSAQATGIIYHAVRSRAPRLALQILRDTVALFNMKSIVEAKTLCTISIAFGSGGKRFEFAFPKCQLLTPSVSDVEGTVGLDLNWRLLPNDGTIVAIPSEACYEILVGARA